MWLPAARVLARRFGARWNPVGVPAVYAAESRALCVLERLVHLSQLPDDEGFTRVAIPSGLTTVTVDRSELPAGWDDPVESVFTQTLGADLMKMRKAAVLRVPSIVVPDEWCLVLNPDHAEFDRIRFGEPVPFRYDHRLRL